MAAEVTETQPILERRSQERALRVLPFLLHFGCVVAVNGWLLWFFHDRFWYAPDEGNYAHVAQRVAAGEVLNLDVQDIHAGYINFLNAAAFKLFGLDLLSLRYPLVAVAFVQAILIFFLFYLSGRRRLAVAIAIASPALGLVQYLNPTSNWYALFLTILIVCALEWIPRQAKARLFVVGFLLGTLVLFRQLSGALVYISVLVYLLLESRSPGAKPSPWDLIVSRLLIVVMALGLGTYLLRTTDAFGLLLFGVCPLLILFWVFVRTTTNNRQVVKLVGSIAAGGLIASLPLLAYHLLTGSLRTWLNDTVFSAVGLTKLDFMTQRLYGTLIIAGGWRFLHPANFGEFVNGLYWIVFPFIGFVNGILLLLFLTRNLKQGDERSRSMTYALPVVAVFYAIVSVHFQIPIYLYYTAALSLAGIMWLIPFKRRFQYSVLAVSLALSAIAVYYHAGQPLMGGLDNLIGGHRNITSLTEKTSSLPRASLKIEAEQEAPYAEVLRVIESETAPTDTIFAVPTNAEFYFLSGRRNPFRFFNTALGIKNDSDFERVRQTIIAQPPRLVLYREDDKYNSNYSREIMRLVRERYDFLGDTAGFAIYRSR